MMRVRQASETPNLTNKIALLGQAAMYHYKGLKSIRTNPCSI